MQTWQICCHQLAAYLDSLRPRISMPRHQKCHENESVSIHESVAIQRLGETLVDASHAAYMRSIWPSNFVSFQ